MPEGPDVRRVADRVSSLVRGVPLLGVRFGPKHLQQHEDRLGSSRVRVIDTIGKVMLTRFECGWTVCSHLYSFGRWHFMPHGEVPQTDRRLRFGMYTTDGDALLYSAMMVEVVPDEKVGEVEYIAKLGPDCLDPAVDVETLRQHMAGGRFDRRMVAHLLLDQSFVAGLGNYLRCEVQFEARIHPRLRVSQLTDTQREAMLQAALEIPRRIYADNDYDFAVFMRNRRPCRVCGTRIVRESIGGRPCSWCPQCQAQPGSG